MIREAALSQRAQIDDRSHPEQSHAGAELVQRQRKNVAGDIISKKTRQEFREHFVGWTLRTIEVEFDAADVPCSIDYRPSCSGERRSLVEKYYQAVDFTDWAHIREVLKVFVSALVKLEKKPSTLSVGWTRTLRSAPWQRSLRACGNHLQDDPACAGHRLR